MDGLQMNKIDGDQLRSKIEKLLPNCSFDEDNEGQVIIYTNLKEKLDFFELKIKIFYSYW
jgi:hypothetical protein